MPDRSTTRYFASLLLSVLTLALLTVGTAHAVTTNSAGLTISPAYVTAQVGSLQPRATTSIGVRNDYDIPVTVTAVLNGFDIRNNALLPTTRTETALADIVSFSPAEITIPPKSSKNIAITVTDKPSLAPGGHYVSLLITQTSGASSKGLPQLALQPAISATVYVIKEDGAVRSLQVTKLRLDGSIVNKPQAADVTFYNNGNVAVIPRGIITIGRGTAGAIYDQAIINSDSLPLYPKQSVTVRSTFTSIAAPLLPGRFTAQLSYRPDGSPDTQSTTVSVWYIPVAAGVLFGLLLVGLIVIVHPKTRQGLTRYNQRRYRKVPKPYVRPDLTKLPETPKKAAENIQQKVRHIDIK